ncbi:MAG: hypothetical protein ACI9IO_000050 [Cyanobium sp.]|jgi:hypothetical protein
MTLSKKLLLALAGTGLVAPMAASANEMASLGGNAAINEYMQQQDVDRFRAWESKNQVTSVNQFSDVQPTDWAYQALSNLVEKYGCVAGYPNGTFKGGNAMTRYEAAALLNACLDRISEVTDELQKLLNEFDSELTVLTSRVDGLESKVGQLEAQQFSTTTKLKGEVSMIIGGVDNWFANAVTGQTADLTTGAIKDKTTRTNYNKTAFNYDLRLSFDTSFSGKDLLRTRMRSGNFSADPFGSSGNVFKLDKAEEGDQTVFIDRLFYTFPVGDQVKLTAGAVVRNTEMLSFLPSAFKSEILDFFNLAGATGTYNKATGAGAGFSWKQKVKKGNPYATFDANWVSQAAAEQFYAQSDTGAFAEDSAQNVLAQLGVKGQNWGAAVAYRYGSENAQLRDPNSPSSSFFRRLGDGQSSNSVSLAGYWVPMDVKWLPSISAGGSYTNYTKGETRPSADIYSWMVGLQWNDVFVKGNQAGFAIGSPLYVTSSNATSASEQTPGYMYQVHYKYQVTNNISITPAIFWIDNNYNDLNAGSSTWGGVIQTTFKF